MLFTSGPVLYPGVTEEECIPVVEKVSGLKYQRGLLSPGYSPERINPGDKLAHGGEDEESDVRLDPR